jgi:hypothetical protein
MQVFSMVLLGVITHRGNFEVSRPNAILAMATTH